MPSVRESPPRGQGTGSSDNRNAQGGSRIFFSVQQLRYCVSHGSVCLSPISPV